MNPIFLKLFKSNQEFCKVTHLNNIILWKFIFILIYREVASRVGCLPRSLLAHHSSSCLQGVHHYIFFILYMLSIVMGMCMCTGAGTCICVCIREEEEEREKCERVCMWRPQVTWWCLPCWFSILFFESKYLTEPKAHQLGQAKWPVIWGSSCLCFLVSSTGVTDVCHQTPLLHGYWGPELRSSCLHSTLLTHLSSP